jgi:hypothetical protein
MLKEFVKDKEREALIRIKRILTEELFRYWLDEWYTVVSTRENNITRSVLIRISRYELKIDHTYGEVYDAPVFTMVFRKTKGTYVDIEEYELDDFDIYKALDFLVTQDTKYIIIDNGNPNGPEIFDVLDLYEDLPFF